MIVMGHIPAVQFTVVLAIVMAFGLGLVPFGFLFVLYLGVKSDGKGSISGDHVGVFTEDDFDVRQGFKNHYESTKYLAEALRSLHRDGARQALKKSLQS